MLPEMNEMQAVILTLIQARGKANPVSYQDLADWLKVSPRLVRKEVEDLVRVFKQPIMSSYNPKAPGYFWPQSPEEVREVCGRLIRHGAAIIKRARTIREVLGRRGDGAVANRAEGKGKPLTGLTGLAGKEAK
jgi:hypothetical protein